MWATVLSNWEWCLADCRVVWTPYRASGRTRGTKFLWVKYRPGFYFCMLIVEPQSWALLHTGRDEIPWTLKSWWWLFLQYPTSTMGLIPPTHPPTTPALETSARRSLTSSILLSETNPVCRAQTGMCKRNPGFGDITGHSWLTALQMFNWYLGHLSWGRALPSSGLKLILTWQDSVMCLWSVWWTACRSSWPSQTSMCTNWLTIF